MRIPARPAVPALVCLAALACSHRHLVLDQAPVGTHAFADRVSTGWRITLDVQETGWEAGSPDEPFEVKARDLQDRTRIEWTVSAERWKQDGDYRLVLRKGERELALVVQNRSREGRVAAGVAIGVAVVGFVALAVATGKHHGGASPKGGPGKGPPTSRDPGPTGRSGRLQSAGGQPSRGPGIVLQLPLPEPGPPPRPETAPDLPLVSVEWLGDSDLPRPLSATIRPVPEGWEVAVELRPLPGAERWTVEGEGFEVEAVRTELAVTARWPIRRAQREEGRPFDLRFQSPQRTGLARVRLR